MPGLTGHPSFKRLNPYRATRRPIPRGHAVRVRIMCELLRLHCLCALERCRKSQCCRGHARCLNAVDVPEPVFARVCWLMLAARLPWITTGRPKERVAYEAWVAAMEARGSRAGESSSHGRERRSLPPPERGRVGVGVS
jgi:hypothetical protein